MAESEEASSFLKKKTLATFFRFFFLVQSREDFMHLAPPRLVSLSLISRPDANVPLFFFFFFVVVVVALFLISFL